MPREAKTPELRVGKPGGGQRSTYIALQTNTNRHHHPLLFPRLLRLLCVRIAEANPPFQLVLDCLFWLFLISNSLSFEP